MSVNESVVFKVPTISKLRALYDNYEVDASMSEYVTLEEQNEDKEFLNTVLDTQVMKTAMNFLHRKGENDSRNMIYAIHFFIEFPFNRLSWFGSR